MERALVMAANILSAERYVEIVVMRSPPESVHHQIHADLAPEVTLTVAPSFAKARKRVRAAHRPVLVGLWTVARSRLLGLPREGWVWWEHSVTAERLRLSGRERLIAWLAARSTNPGAVVVPAAFMQSETYERVRRPVTVIPNGGVEVSSGGAASPRTRFGHSVVGTIGRLHAARRTALAIRSLVDAPAVELRVAGDGPERMALEELSRELGLESRVVFEGWITDKAAFFSSIDALIVTSPTETFGYSLFEAAAYGVQVVACRNPRTQEIIPRLVPGVLVDGHDAAAVAAAMNGALARPMSAAAFTSAAELREAELSPEVIRQRWYELLDADRR